ncbi:hypothetical protein REPUB_Repub17cG0185900 [Reevesia pubescens]
MGANGDWVSNRGTTPYGNFVNYLPQDEAVATRLGAEEGGLDPVESQRVVDLLKRELSRLLKLSPREFWKQVSSYTSLHEFIDSFLKFRSRWYDFPHRVVKGIIAGSSNRDPGARAVDNLSANDHNILPIVAMASQVMGDRSGNIRWWDVTTGHSSSFNTHREGIRRIKFSPIVAGDHSRGRIAVLFYDNTFSVFDLDSPDALANSLLQPQFPGTLVLELDWLHLRTDKNDPLVTIILPFWFVIDIASAFGFTFTSFQLLKFLLTDDGLIFLKNGHVLDEMSIIWHSDFDQETQREAIQKAMLIVFLILSFGFGIGNCQSLNVVNFGAIGNGRTDDSMAFSKAWTALCAATNNPTLEIPSGKTFLLSTQLEFSGPCNSKTIHIKVLGKIIAPKSNTWAKCDNGCWLCFSNVAGLTVDGTGQIDGNGAAWWNKTAKECAPAVLSFHKCDNLNVHGITSLNSPGNHVSVNNCNEVDISHIQLIAPQDSPNTDGIDISASTALRISDSFFGTGDDCIAINGGTSHLNITRLTCGPGHGISVGSLGKGGKNETVEWVQVQNSIFNGTQNGARIKSWAGGIGFARNIFFDGAQLTNVQNPIIIDQHYCPEHNCSSEGKTAVNINNVRFSGFQGTSATEVAIKLDCSSILPCTDITLNNNKISSSIPGKEVKAECNNAQGSSTLTTPKVPCLSSPKDGIAEKVVESTSHVYDL